MTYTLSQTATLCPFNCWWMMAYKSATAKTLWCEECGTVVLQ